MAIFEIFQLLFMILAVIVEYYFIYAFVRSKMGKYPPYVPSKKGMAELITREAAFVLDETSVSKKIVEPGCGDARVSAMLAKTYPQHRFIGYEWDFFPYFLAKLRTGKYKNLKILKQNFMTVDYSDVDLAVLFTGNEIAPELSQKLAAELPDDAVVISESFELPRFKCVKKIETDKKNYWFLPQKIFIYKKNG